MKPKIHIESVVLGNKCKVGWALATYKDEEIICYFEYDCSGSIDKLEFLSNSSVPIEIDSHERFVAEASITKLVGEKLYHA